MALNKQALVDLIASQTGNSDFTEDMIDDSILSSLIVDDEIEEEDEVDETDVDNETDVDEEDDEVEDEDEEVDEEEDDLFADLDPSKLSPTEKLFYDHIMNEKKKSKQREISIMITSSDLGIKHKMILDRMAKDGVSSASIKKTIEDFKELETASARTGAKSRILSKSKVKTKAGSKKDSKNKIPKFGTKEFGKYLAELKK